jgi:hypothetical protein
MEKIRDKGITVTRRTGEGLRCHTLLIRAITAAGVIFYTALRTLKHCLGNMPMRRTAGYSGI